MNYLRAKLLAQITFLIATIDSNNAQSHRLSILQGHNTKTTTSTNNRNSLTRTSIGLLQSLVHRKSSAENRRDPIQSYILRQDRNVGSFTNRVLLECAVDGVTRELGCRAKRFIRGLAVLAGQA